MTDKEMRDMFAAAALQGLISKGAFDITEYSQHAGIAYLFADRMMAERAKRDNTNNH